jgi:hypothetical protein
MPIGFDARNSRFRQPIPDLRRVHIVGASMKSPKSADSPTNWSKDGCGKPREYCPGIADDRGDARQHARPVVDLDPYRWMRPSRASSRKMMLEKPNVDIAARNDDAYFAALEQFWIRGRRQ